MHRRSFPGARRARSSPLFSALCLLFLGFLFGALSASWFAPRQPFASHPPNPPVSLSEFPHTAAPVVNGSCAWAAMAAAERYAAVAASSAHLRTTRGVLRIAGFSRLWIPPLHNTGGMQYHAFHIYAQLAARGHFVHVFVTGPPQASTLRRLAYCTDPNTHKTSLCPEDTPDARLVVQQVVSTQDTAYSVRWLESCLEAFRLIHAERPFDVAHSESWAAVPNSDQLGVPLTVTWHGSMLDWFRNEINYVVHNYRMQRKVPGAKVRERMRALASVVPLETYALLNVPQHIAISDAAADELREMHHVESFRVARVYNGVDRHMFRPSWDAPGTRAAFLEALGVPHGHFVVGCGGRLEAIKGHRQLAAAMRLVMAAHQDITLLVAGKGAQSDLYSQMKRDGLRVVMLGMMSQEKLARFYQSIDVFVDPFYQHHGLNTVMIEAALSGVPLVVTHLGSARSVVPCDDFGRTFTLGDTEGLTREVLYYKLHPDERLKVAQRTFARATLLFGSDTMAGQYEHVLYNTRDAPPMPGNMTGKVVCLNVYPAMCYREAQ